MSEDNRGIRFFLFSKQQMDMRIKVDGSIGQKYKPGRVIVKGKYKLFTEISTKPNNSFNDTKVVLKEDINKVIYEEPVSI